MKIDKVKTEMEVYKRNIFLLVLFCSLFIVSAVLLVLALFNILPFSNFFIEFCLFAFGALTPLIVNCAIRISDTQPWQINLRHLIRTGQIQKDSLLRISFSFTYSVNVDGDFFLIMNAHGIGLYQTPAQTYPLTEEQKNSLKTRFGCKEDDNIKRDYSDYRFYVPAKRLKAFCREFFNTHNPEKNSPVDYSVEFVHYLPCKELKESGLFDRVKYHFKRRNVGSINYDDYYQCYSLSLADIFEVELSEEQINFLRKLKDANRSTNEYKFANEDEIRRNGVIKGVNNKQTIAYSAKQIL